MLVTISDAEPGGAAGGRERARRIAVASGKGGVGKTWLAITLGHALAAAGQHVLLFDGDLGLANVDIQLGLTPIHDLGAVVAGQASIAEVAQRHADGGFDIVAGRSGSGALSALDPIALERMLTALRDAADRYDIVLLDLGAGLDRAVRRMAAWADALLVVATEEPTSLTDAYAVLKLYVADRACGDGREPGFRGGPAAGPGGVLGTAPSPGDARIIVNQASNRPSGERTYSTLRRACERFLGRAPPLAGVIRRDERVKDAIRRQTLLLIRHPACPAAADVEAAAESLNAPPLCL
jgi:flagellar biosynthesis protein FlhG